VHCHRFFKIKLADNFDKTVTTSVVGRVYRPNTTDREAGTMD